VRSSSSSSPQQELIAAEVALADALRSGVVLCELFNAIQPGAIKKVNKGKFPAHQHENIGNFVQSCRALGVPDAENFETADLYDERNLMQVWRCVASLGKHLPEAYTGPLMTSEADLRAEVNKAAADAKAAERAEAEAAAEAAAAAARAEEEARKATEAQAAAAAAAAAARQPDPEPEPQPQPQPELEPQAEPEPEPAADDKAEPEPQKEEDEVAEDAPLLGGGDAAMSEGVPPAKAQRSRWWCCTTTAPAPAPPPPECQANV